MMAGWAALLVLIWASCDAATDQEVHATEPKRAELDTAKPVTFQMSLSANGHFQAHIKGLAGPLVKSQA